MTSYSRKVRILALLVTLFGFAVAAFGDDPPSRAMRLRYISGQVSMQPGGVNDWVEAGINRPLTTADRIWADKDSRAELSLGTASLRIKDETSMTLSNLNDSTVQIELDQGTLNLTVRQMYAGEIYEIDTPNVAFTLTKPGAYRFEVDSERDETLVIVRKGEGEGTGDRRGVTVRSGEEVRFEHGDTLMYSTARARGLDGFDDWCRTRDSREDSSEALRYVPSDMVGYEDLDDNGSWRNYPEYGAVWIPRHVVADWAPYRYGHWAWIEPWGWTWVDDAPWGFAPFHYGRWVYVGGYWGWSPGPRTVRPVYAPALVAWVGGRNWGVGVSLGGGVSWVPLGYGEAYYPSYRVSERYVRNVNITNTRITNITYVTNNYTEINRGHHVEERYTNQRVQGAVTMVRQHEFANARPVGQSRVRISDRDAAMAPRINDAEVAPGRPSVLGANQGRRASAPPAGVVGKPVWAKQTPPERPVSFERRRGEIERNGGRPLDDAQINELRSRRGSEAGRPTQDAAGREAGRREAPRPNAAPEMRGRTEESPVAEAARPGRADRRPQVEREAAQQEGMRPPERMPRAPSGEANVVTPQTRSNGDTPNSGSRREGWGVPRPPRSAEGKPQVSEPTPQVSQPTPQASQPQQVREHPETREQNPADRWQNRRQQPDSEQRQQNRPERESRQQQNSQPAAQPQQATPQQHDRPERENRRPQQNTEPSVSRPPAPPRNEAPAARPEPQQRPQVQQHEQKQDSAKPPKQQNEHKRNEEKSEGNNWRGQGGSRGQ
jgi:hypothetical protein